MNDIHANITRLKFDLNETSSSAILDDIYETSNDNVIYITNINDSTIEKAFNPNTKRLLVDNLDFNSLTFKVCNNCKIPISANAIDDHLRSCCTSAKNVSSGVSNGGSNRKNNSSNTGTPNSSNDTSSNNYNQDNSDDGYDNDDFNINTNHGSNGNNNNGDEDDDEDDDDDDDEDDDEDDDDAENNSRSNSKRPPPFNNDELMKFKKMKSSGQNNTKSKQRRERRVKQRNPTEKHLIDFDKQCGVELPEGGYCARSLTCKSHPMGAKRSVMGRSKPFDDLLAEYHREHQTKIGAAAEKRAKQQQLQKKQKQILKEQKEQKKLLQQKQRQLQKQNKSKTLKNSNSSYNKNSKNANMNNDYAHPNLTPEEETTQVLNGVSRSFPLPLESTVLSSTRRRTKYFRMREMFASAFSIKPGYSSPGYGAIHSRVGCIDMDRTTDYKFRIRVPQPNNTSGMNIPANTNVQRLQEVQQQRLLQAQLLQQQKLQAQAQAQQQLRNQAVQTTNNSPSQIQKQHSNQQQTIQQQQINGLTPQEIQQQQQKLRQQQFQQQKFEAAAFHLANSTKPVQNNKTILENNVNTPSPAISSVSNNGSPQMDGNLNLNITNQVNPNGSRVN
ncbi:hypothetical protein KAFR_0K02310 [Kazachstania africana CBS 2517]|uniref:SCA7 domain-containing protein n=1 Tax=Kazachstania africana (strain ATCC 22294 / BCRC 22015 / CBS 2517 / CECT 1963 / NBRC 1671 / NRRL Y-8276) TaxID=1071382 RepID=H2B1T6_KAZAF|nr:hypothetical protein KAFR_0K02310 [Kazachstania africana CBS 2517]CCF60586.1 hypothetical protein KAFR_0K02310 [Kazachstania africana CBS 2517]